MLNTWVEQTLFAPVSGVHCRQLQHDWGLLQHKSVAEQLASVHVQCTNGWLEMISNLTPTTTFYNVHQTAWQLQQLLHLLHSPTMHCFNTRWHDCLENFPSPGGCHLLLHSPMMHCINTRWHDCFENFPSPGGCHLLLHSPMMHCFNTRCHDCFEYFPSPGGCQLMHNSPVCS